jgi:hypothetical protein
LPNLLLPFRTFLLPFVAGFASVFAMVVVLHLKFDFVCTLPNLLKQTARQTRTFWARFGISLVFYHILIWHLSAECLTDAVRFFDG